MYLQYIGNKQFKKKAVTNRHSVYMYNFVACSIPSRDSGVEDHPAIVGPAIRKKKSFSSINKLGDKFTARKRATEP